MKIYICPLCKKELEVFKAHSQLWVMHCTREPHNGDHTVSINAPSKRLLNILAEKYLEEAK